MARERTVDIDAQQPLRLGPAERAFRVLEIGDQRETAPVKALAVERRADMTRGPLKETHAEPRLESLHRVRHGRTRHAQILRGDREAASLHHPREHPHSLESVHLSVRDFRIVMPDNGSLSGVTKGPALYDRKRMFRNGR